jgi:release factor glutamine methyltransferase
LKEQVPDLLEKNPYLRFLEIGAGSGIHLETAYTLGIKRENILSSDINEDSVSHCNALGFNCVHSDLFENIIGKFDIMIFNPPYLPQDSREPEDSRIITTGGIRGNEIILRFLNDAIRYLNEDGKIFLITSNVSEQVDFKKLGYEAKELGCERLFFESLCIWELKVIRNN